MGQPEADVTAAASPLRRVVGITSLIAVVLGLLVWSFAWPASRGEASDLTIAVTGQAELAGELTAAIGDGLGEAVDLVVASDRDEIVELIQTRTAIGGIVLTMEGAEVLTASANGQVPAAFMTALASQLQATLDAQVYSGVLDALHGALSTGGPADPAGVVGQVPEALPTVAVTDVVPHSESDPNGVGITAAGIPLTVGALLAGVAIAFTVAGPWQRLSAIVGLGIAGGLVLALVAGTWLQVYPGSFASIWLALALSLMATSGLVVGLHGVLGRVGLALAGALTLFAAMPWAAFAVPYEFLPAGLGHIGQWLVPGAASTLMRTVSYFPDASATGPWWVLTIWTLLGLALILARGRTARPAGSRATA